MNIMYVFQGWPQHDATPVQPRCVSPWTRCTPVRIPSPPQLHPMQAIWVVRYQPLAAYTFWYDEMASTTVVLSLSMLTWQHQTIILPPTLTTDWAFRLPATTSKGCKGTCRSPVCPNGTCHPRWVVPTKRSQRSLVLRIPIWSYYHNLTSPELSAMVLPRHEGYIATILSVVVIIFFMFGIPS